MKAESIMDDSTRFLLSIVVPITSLAGLANLLRSEKDISVRAVLSVILNSGLFGLAIAAYLLSKLGADSFGLVLSISILSGLGGNAAIDFALELFKTVVRNYAKSAGKPKDE